jgi:hypothetical protein
MTTKQFDNFADIITFTRASTGTYLDSDGLLKTATTNTPRIEYDINGNRKGLLIEEARTNLLLRSEALTTSPWAVTSANTILTANDRIAPDGNQTATKFVATAFNNNGTFCVTNAGTTVASKSFTLSVWVYADTTFDFTLRSRGTGTTQEAQNTTVSTVAGQWVRVSSTHTFTGAADGSEIIVALYTAVFGVDNTNTLWFWGAQLEQASFPTSYIPTAGSTATRAADVASIPTSAFGYNAKIGAGGTVIADFQSDNWTDTTNTQFFRVWNLNPTAGSGLFKAGQNNGQFRYRFNDTANNAVFGPETISASAASASTGAKIAIAYAKDDFALYSNGSQVATDSAGLFANEVVTALWLGSEGGVSQFANGYLKSIQYYPRRLSNQQLVDLTS